MSNLTPISLPTLAYDFTITADIREKGLFDGDSIHAEIPHGTKTFILCYVDRACPTMIPFYARMFFN